MSWLFISFAPYFADSRYKCASQIHPPPSYNSMNQHVYIFERLHRLKQKMSCKTISNSLVSSFPRSCKILQKPLIVFLQLYATLCHTAIIRTKNIGLRDPNHRTSFVNVLLPQIVEISKELCSSPLKDSI